MTSTTVEIFQKGRRIDSHVRSHQVAKHTTKKEHMPKAHQESLQWPPSRIIEAAREIGPMTMRLVSEILAERSHPEQGYRPCMGIIRLVKQWGSERVEAACSRAHLAGDASTQQAPQAAAERLLHKLASCSFVGEHMNVLVTGMAGSVAEVDVAVRQPWAGLAHKSGPTTSRPARPLLLPRPRLHLLGLRPGRANAHGGGGKSRTRGPLEAPECGVTPGRDQARFVICSPP
jgi:hypothetical protein